MFSLVRTYLLFKEKNNNKVFGDKFRKLVLNVVSQ